MDRPSLVAHIEMVGRMATRVSRRVPASVERDELVAAGLEGLVRAGQRYDEARGVHFRTFASFHVRGAMIEHLRHLDIMSRNERRLKNTISRTGDRLRAQLGREPTEAEMAGELQMSTAEYCELSGRLGDARVTSADGDQVRVDADAGTLQLASPSLSPEQQLIDDEDPSRMWRAVSELPDRQRIVIELAHREALTLREIGERLGISESRVSQLRKSAIGRLRKRLAGESRRAPGPRAGATTSRADGRARAPGHSLAGGELASNGGGGYR